MLILSLVYKKGNRFKEIIVNKLVKSGFTSRILWLQRLYSEEHCPLSVKMYLLTTFLFG